MSRPAGLPLPADFSALPRVMRLRLWLRGQSLTLVSLAGVLGVHKTAPGKWLIKCNEPLPPARRAELLELGMPEGLLPER